MMQLLFYYHFLMEIVIVIWSKILQTFLHLLYCEL